MLNKVIDSGMLPAVDLDGQIITESDRILASLESEFGPLYKSMNEQRGNFIFHFLLTQI